MKVAVVGAGLFGCTAAIYAARAGHKVTLIDKASDIMKGATFCNQFRLHRGYHYPRSEDTGRQCRNGLKAFAGEYGKAFIPYGKKHFYAIARDSRTPAGEYLNFLSSQGLESHIVERREPLMNPETLELAVQVEEGFLDYEILKDLVHHKLMSAGVIFRPHTEIHPLDRDDYDYIIVACYAGNSGVLDDLFVEEYKPTQFEVVEKPVFQLPRKYRNTGVVVMDGPYGCIDPYGKTGYHVMGHVEHAIHNSNVGDRPHVPPWLPSGRMDYVNAGIIENPDRTKYVVMRDALSKYLPFVQSAKYVGSMFTVRTVLPNKDETDERPTLVTRHDEQVVSIFSGKLGTAVDAAIMAVNEIDRKVP